MLFLHAEHKITPLMNLPLKFVERTKALLLDEYAAFETALEQIPPTSIRVNRKLDYKPEGKEVTWCPNAYYLNQRPLFTADPLFHAGVYYVQEASSMFLSQAIQQFFPDAETVLDLCAAPGGKSTLLAQTLSDDCLLVSNEIIRSRAYILAENISKWGNTNVIVSNNEPADFSNLEALFDAILVDAPCSGEGMFRKDPGAITEWSENNVNICAERQRNILNDVWDALKPGGILVYSTCTYNRLENEENVEWICNELGAELLRVDLNGNSDIVVTDFGYRFFPHRTRGEGFFLSVLKKAENASFFKIGKQELKKGTKFVNQDEFPFQLDNSKKWLLVDDNNFIRAYEADKWNKFMLLNKKLKCVDSGLLVAEVKGKDIIPSTQLALSTAFDTTNINSVDVDYETAISFLKKEAISLPNESKGYLLIKYKNQPLGWVKNIGNRCNNLYPNNWRIRMNL